MPKNTWNLDKLDDPERRERLLAPPTPKETLAALIGEAMRAGRVLLEWEPARDWSGCYRITVKIPVSSLLFDQLFNGRSGYRAQYYLSIEDGRRYNRAIVDGLIPAVQESHDKLAGFETPWRLIEQSLRGASSKIWMPSDLETLKASPAALQPPRWREFWRNSETAWGLRVPLPPSSHVDLKGAFIRPGSSEDFPSKPDRDLHIHEEGWPR